MLNLVTVAETWKISVFFTEGMFHLSSMVQWVHIYSCGREVCRLRRRSGGEQAVGNLSRAINQD